MMASCWVGTGLIAAYQLEGSISADGKGPNTYDHWFNQGSGNQITENGNVAIDHYNRWSDDLTYIKTLGATAYRFSISWSRIFPNCNGATPNAAGIAFYSKYIDRIRAMGAEPYLTMFHWDLPQACVDQYQGFASPKIVQDFVNYADVLFKNFGDRITYWLTLNEADANCKFGYQQPPQPDNATQASICGFPTADPSIYCLAPALGLGPSGGKWACMKNSHLIHGSVVQHARKNYPNKNWKFGMPAIISWYQAVPADDPTYLAKAQNSFEVDVGEFWDPIVFGDWSTALKNNPGSQLDATAYFTPDETAIIKGTMDFIALNYYTVYPVGADGAVVPDSIQRTDNYWTTIYAPGLQGVLKQAHAYYTSHGANLDIHVTECGVDVQGEWNMTLEEAVANDERVQFWRNHTQYLEMAITQDKVPVKAFMAWSLFDNFEWTTYQHRYGQIAVAGSYGNNLTRTIKHGGYFLRDYFSKSTSPFPPVSAPDATSAAPAAATGAAASGTPSPAASVSVTSVAAPVSTKSAAHAKSWSMEVAVLLIAAAIGVIA
ncbi:hypothetical protein HK101_000956 [Irineochytrium annulatum]|nr:hypothetical protein HK101_000956 [Irineochytrium annulatum]